MPKWLAKLLPFLFVKEYNCIVCGRELAHPTAEHTCSSCYVKMEFIGDDACMKCGRKLVAEEEYCLDCQKNEMHFDRAIAPLSYTGSAAMLVRKLKFNNRRFLVSSLARYMTNELLRKNLSADCVIPVPLYPKRQKERGYNQSELLAREIAKAFNLPLLTEAAARIKDTLPSTKLEGGRNAREENVKDAFVLKDPDAVQNRDVLVIDDVLTTGATTSELAKVLKRAGANKVYVLTFASTKERPPIDKDEPISLK